MAKRGRRVEKRRASPIDADAGANKATKHAHLPQSPSGSLPSSFQTHCINSASTIVSTSFHHQLVHTSDKVSSKSGRKHWAKVG